MSFWAARGWELSLAIARFCPPSTLGPGSGATWNGAAVPVDHVTAGRPDRLECVDRQALVVVELPRVPGDRPAAGGPAQRVLHGRDELWPGRRWLADQVRAVVEQAGVGVERQRPQLVLVLARVERALQEASRVQVGLVERPD